MDYPLEEIIILILTVLRCLSTTTTILYVSSESNYVAYATNRFSYSRDMNDILVISIQERYAVEILVLLIFECENVFE